jgi:hypothetical protein
MFTDKNKYILSLYFKITSKKLPAKKSSIRWWLAPKIYDGEKTASSTNVTGKTGYPSAKN